MSPPTAPTGDRSLAEILAAAPLGPRLEFEDVTIRAPDGAVWLDRIRFSVPPGGHVAVTGCSGSGKSALLRAAIGLRPVDAGCVRVAGAAVGALSYRARQALRTRSGYVFERQGLLSNQTLRQNVALPLRYHRGGDPIDVEGRVTALLRELEIEQAADRRPEACNASVQKRALVARALSVEPTLLLLEEPQASLVPREQALVNAAIERRRARLGTTVLQTDHDGSFGPLRPDRVVALDGGRVVSVTAVTRT